MSPPAAWSQDGSSCSMLSWLTVPSELQVCTCMHVGACDKGQTSEGWGCRGGQLRGTGKARSHGDSLGGHTRVSGHTTHNLRCVLSTFVYVCVW